MRTVPGKRMCKVLESRGWLLLRVTGSHHVYWHPLTKSQTVVPVHANADLKPGTQRRIMRDAGLKDGDL